LKTSVLFSIEDGHEPSPELSDPIHEGLWFIGGATFAVRIERAVVVLTVVVVIVPIGVAGVVIVVVGV
jgi:hypothetical protein